jgi:molybdopterin adenylyltransferase
MGGVEHLGGGSYYRARPAMERSARVQAAVVTVSDGVARGVRDDASGRAVRALLEGSGFEVVRSEVVPDELETIVKLLEKLTDEVPLVVTTGGTGLGPRDVTPEATRAVVEREAPGLAEEMRAAGRGSTPFAALSRGIAGSRGSSFILNLPGSTRGATECLQAVLPALPHAVQLLAGDTVHGPSDEDPPPLPGGAHASHGGRRHAGFRPATGSEATTVEEELAIREAAGEDVVLATAIRVEGSPPCRVGQKMLLGAGGGLAGTLGCAEFDDAAIADAPALLASRAPATRTYSHELGTVDVFLEPLARSPLLIVFSATPIARNLVRWGADLGFHPVLVESRPERVTSEDAVRPPASLDDLAIEQDTAAVHTDHDAPNVVETVARLLRSPAGFIGVMGSRRHVGAHLERLRRMGFDADDLARIHTPVGLDIGARSAEEIALSILAGLVAARRGAGGGWLDRP